MNHLGIYFLDYHDTNRANFCIQTVLQRGKTYLHMAAQTGQSELFEAMLNEEKDKNPRSTNGQTPFHTACEFGQTQIGKTNF